MLKKSNTLKKIQYIRFWIFFSILDFGTWSTVDIYGMFSLFFWVEKTLENIIKPYYKKNYHKSLWEQTYKLHENNLLTICFTMGKNIKKRLRIT